MIYLYIHLYYIYLYDYVLKKNAVTVIVINAIYYTIYPTIVVNNNSKKSVLEVCRIKIIYVRFVAKCETDFQYTAAGVANYFNATHQKLPLYFRA